MEPSGGRTRRLGRFNEVLIAYFAPFRLCFDWDIFQSHGP